MFPAAGALFGGSGGFSGSSSSGSDAVGGRVNFGGFNFQPKGGNLPPAAWIALAVAAAAFLIFKFARKR